MKNSTVHQGFWVVLLILNGFMLWMDEDQLAQPHLAPGTMICKSDAVKNNVYL